MRVLVTGGAGFIGSHLVRELLARHHEVRVLDDFSTGHRANLQAVEADVECFEGDMRDADLTLRAMQGVECVFHEAALPSVPRSIADPVTSTSVNVMGITTLLKSAVDAGVRRMVYAASSSAYGNVDDRVKSEGLSPRPLSPYAVTKLAGEYMLKAFSHCYGLETVGLRYFNVFGERQDPHSQYSGVIAKFCRQMIQNDRPTIHGSGEISRDFTYVRNVVDANLLAAVSPTQANGSIFNIACGGNVSLNQLVSHLNSILRTDLSPIYGPDRSGDVLHSCADIRLAKEVLGYQPGVDFATGLQRTVDWYRSELSTTSTNR
jgi:UDP-glucose 4-epimerase